MWSPIIGSSRWAVCFRSPKEYLKKMATRSSAINSPFCTWLLFDHKTVSIGRKHWSQSRDVFQFVSNITSACKLIVPRLIGLQHYASHEFLDYFLTFFRECHAAFVQRAPARSGNHHSRSFHEGGQEHVLSDASHGVSGSAASSWPFGDPERFAHLSAGSRHWKL